MSELKRVLLFFLPCVLTVMLETPIFFFAGYRSKTDLTIVVCTNVVSNLLLQLCFLIVPFTAFWLVVLELAVLAGEYLLYAAAFGRSKRLFLLTLFANAFSCGIGLLIRFFS